MKNIVILGAAGQTGGILVDEALKAGFKVTGFIREGEELEARKNLVVIKGDARKADDLEFALGGQDAVISTLGSTKFHDDVISESTRSLLKAMHANKVKRVIMMSSFMASDRVRINPLSWLVRKVMAATWNDKNTGEELLKSSDLDWTIVYCTRLGDGPRTGMVRVVPKEEKVTTRNGIDRTDVAEFFVKEVVSGDHIRESILITVR